ncbi:testicular haploid expressed gene protein-like [Acipenser ruthenus]|uniref:testicular haploid expressed gene protein-like n=1 Tax=Acipenser ruthenus TaxID=7906 RepID=UPI0027418C1C|nr:testicular haploid expressed gene protein-like [Acipenser ruthenus]XP_058871248.1 testicular haploid expressed gene protein-like [Acipenser ruthenus]
METRIDVLAKPKKNFLKFPDRHSVYWLDNMPSQRAATTSVLTPRLSELSQFKALNTKYSEDRRSPIWTVSAAALKSTATKRLEELAQPKAVSQEWEPQRFVYSVVSEAVKSAVPSPRILQLARPKRRYPPVARDSLIWSPEQGISIVTEAACSAVATPRLQDLATAKKVHPLFLPEKPTAWPVPESAMKVVASDRVHMLAKPKVRKGIFEGYDPYLVTETAKQAQASLRVLELSTPLPRKVRHKKI